MNKERRSALCRPWRFSIIVKVLGRSVNYPILQQRVIKLWGLLDDTDLIDWSYGYYIVKLGSKEALAKVLSGGPWKIMDHYLLVQRWKPYFRPSLAPLGKTAVWIRLPELPIEFFNADLLMEIGNQIGKPIKVDTKTTMATRGKFARVCVEVNLSKPLITRV